MKKKLQIIFLTILLIFSMTACGAKQDAAPAGDNTSGEKNNRDISSELTYKNSMELAYATTFSVDYYEDGYALVTIADTDRYLVIPEGKEAPKDLAEDITPLPQPIRNIYLVASATMDMFVSLDALDSVRFSGLKEESWYIPEAREAMEHGDILYAGQYSSPDYERILSENCGLAVENTMISHTPEVGEQLEKFGIPVLIDYSSYEENPLGRTEWVKLYGLLTGHTEEAEAAFAKEVEAFDSISEQERTDDTVAFFYITTDGEANVRRSSDYLPKMIELAGGKYIFENLGDDKDTASSTLSMQMEEFYAQAKDADYIIYNSAIDGELSSVDELLDKSSLLEKLKAVQEGHVYCTSKNLYQSSMSLGTIMSDIHKMLTGDDAGMTYLYRLE